jgi:hypothetical protein
MKKRLESELISIAHRILKLKNKSEVDQLYLETRKLYETLAVLKFYGDNYEQVKAEVSQEELDEKLAEAVSTIEEEVKEMPTEEVVAIEQAETVLETEEEEEIGEEDEEDEEEIEDQEEDEDDEIDEEVENEEDEEDEEEEDEIDEEENEEDDEADDEDEFENAIHFEPIFELADDFEVTSEEIVESEDEEEVAFEPETKKAEPNKIESRQISFEDLLGESFNEPEFVKPNDVVIPPSLKEVIEEKPLSLNDQHSKAINIGMNDRIAFVKHLFDDSTEDYNRVLSQLNSFTTKEEAVDFIEEIIKPDYNNWDGSEEYAERFMEIVKNKFN